jgi:NAD(P)H dehydrogenase (quinone)
MPDSATNREIRHLVVLGHPNADSFNGAVARTWCEEVEKFGQTAVLDDLYRRGFDPALAADELPGADYRPAPDIAPALARIAEADMLVMVYPIWFGMPPAIVKGYVDRVLGANFSAEEVKANLPNPMLEGKRLTIISTSAATRPWLEERGQWLALKQAFDTYLTRAFGLADCHHIHFDAIVPGLKQRFVDEHLEVVRQTARERSAVLKYGDLPPRLLRQPDF